MRNACAILLVLGCIAVASSHSSFCSGEGKRTMEVWGCQRFTCADRKKTTAFNNGYVFRMEEKDGSPTKLQISSTDKTPTLQKTLSISNLSSNKDGSLLRLETDNEAECISMKPSIDLTIFAIDIAEDGTVTPSFDCAHCTDEAPDKPMAVCNMLTTELTCAKAKKEDTDSHSPSDKKPKNNGIGLGVLVGLSVLATIGVVFAVVLWYRQRIMSARTAPLLDRLSMSAAPPAESNN